MKREEFEAMFPPEWRERFCKKIEFGTGCWIWTAARSKGYGAFQERTRTTMYAHRLVVQYAMGGLIDGLEIDHLCRVRACVNPDHLEQVTAAVNTLRGYGAAANNARKTHCRNGHPLGGTNVYPHDIGNSRTCRICANTWARADQAKMRLQRRMDRPIDESLIGASEYIR